MKFAINTLLYTAGFDREHLPLLKKFKAWGFDGVEIARFDFKGWPAAEIRRAVHDEGLETVFCSALTGDTSLVAEDAGVRARARAFLEEGIETAAEAGASVLAGPFCAPVGQLFGRRRTADEWKRAVEGLQALTPALDACGVTLAVEPLNRFETYFLNTMADGKRLCQEVRHPRVGILFDTFHANIEEKNLGDALRLLGGCLAHVHTCENDRGIPGTGNVQWDGVFRGLKDIGYNGWAAIESFGSSIPEIAAAACIWRDLAPTTDAIPAEGIQFLRRGLL